VQGDLGGSVELLSLMSLSTRTAAPGTMKRAFDASYFEGLRHQAPKLTPSQGTRLSP